MAPPKLWVVPLAYRDARGGAGGAGVKAPPGGSIPATLGAYTTTTGALAPTPSVVAAAARYRFAPTRHPEGPSAPSPGAGGTMRDTAPAEPRAVPFQRLTGAVAAALGAARAEAIRRVPWFAKGILQLRPVALPGYGTFGVTEGKVLIVDPELVLAWCFPVAGVAGVGRGVQSAAPDPGGVAILANVLAHEALHPFLNHAERARALPGYVPEVHHDRANRAADVEIHSILFAAGCHEWPWQVCHAQGYGLPPNMPMEWYFVNLPASAPGAEGQGVPGAGACGSGAHGNASPIEVEADRQFGATPVEAESERRIVAATITAYAKQHPGSVPGGVLRHVDTITKPVDIPWQATAAARVGAAIDLTRRGSTRTYLRANRKQGGIGWGTGRAILAASKAPTPTVWVWVDTSGSMGREELVAGLGVVLGVLARTGARVVFGAFDAKVQSLGVVHAGVTGAALAQHLKGGGGSNAIPAFEAASTPPRGLPAPGVMVVFTDGHLTVPARAPAGIETVWVTGPTPRHTEAGGKDTAWHRRPAPWGEHVVVDLSAGRVVAHTQGSAA